MCSVKFLAVHLIQQKKKKRDRNSRRNIQKPQRFHEDLYCSCGILLWNIWVINIVVLPTISSYCVWRVIVFQWPRSCSCCFIILYSSLLHEGNRTFQSPAKILTGSRTVARISPVDQYWLKHLESSAGIWCLFPACLCFMNGNVAAAASPPTPPPPRRPQQLYKNPVWETYQTLPSCSARIFECLLHEYQAVIATVVRVCVSSCGWKGCEWVAACN